MDSPAPSRPPLTDHPKGWWGAFGWGAFLACSWTWCIGMFLPVLLLRDFGPLSFLVFAVPNIIGAAAMGLILREPGLSERLVARHAGLCQFFSVVTRAFQFFFLAWLGIALASRSAVIIYLGVFLLGLIMAMRPYEWPRRARHGAVATWLISAGLLLAAWRMDAFVWPGPMSLHNPELLWLSPVIVFGFALCPYLDLTFHFARRQARGRTGDRAFVIGFCLLFAAMILGTYAYARLFLLERHPFGSGALLAIPGILVVLHIALQLGFTIGLHDVRVDRPSGRMLTDQGIGWGAVGVILAIAQMWIPDLFGLDSGEVIYRCFMAFYGLVFPAYVWICMIPVRGVDPRPTRARVNLWLASVALAAPMFFMGFIVRETWWLAPGLAVVLLARLLVRPLSAPAAAAHTG